LHILLGNSLFVEFLCQLHVMSVLEQNNNCYKVDVCVTFVILFFLSYICVTSCSPPVRMPTPTPFVRPLPPPTIEAAWFKQAESLA
jgi:hypothetical protein